MQQYFFLIMKINSKIKFISLLTGVATILLFNLSCTVKSHALQNQIDPVLEERLMTTFAIFIYLKLE